MGFVLITGASEGLGREFARIAAREGRALVISSRRAEVLEAFAAELRGLGAPVVEVVAADLAEDGAAERLWAQAVALGRIEVLVNNAGLGAAGAFVDRAEWGREVQSVMVNVLAATVLMKEACVHMASNGGGRILNVASLAGFMPGPWMAVYHATKAYVVSLSEGVAQEMAGTGVTVTALCPGPVATRFFDAAGIEGATVIQRIGLADPGKVARAGWRGMLRGRRIVLPRADTWIFAQGVRFAPRRLTAWLAGIFLRPH